MQRDLVLGVASKKIRGVLVTSYERQLLEFIASMPEYRNPVQVACSRCQYNVIILIDESETPPAQTFLREDDGKWRCLSCGTSAQAKEVRIH